MRCGRRWARFVLWGLVAVAVVPAVGGAAEPAPAGLPAAVPVPSPELTATPRAAPATRASASLAVRVSPASGTSLEVAALLLSDRQGGSLPVAVTAFAVPGAAPGASGRVAVALEVQGQPWLAAAPAGSPARLAIAAYLLADDGSVAADAFETVELVTADARERAVSGGLRHLLFLAAPSGHYTARVLVRDALRPDLLALRRLDVVVPAVGGALWLPRVVDRGTAWMDTTPERVQELPWHAWVPVRAVWEIGEPQALRVEDTEAPGSAGGPNGAAPTVELIDPAGATIALPWLESRSAGGGVEGKVVVRAVPAGEYQLVVGGGSSKHVQSPAISVVLLDGDPAGRAWVEFTVNGGEENRPLATPSTVRRLHTSEIGSLRTGVEQARQALADARPSSAAAALRAPAEAILTGAEPVAGVALAEAVTLLLRDAVREQPARLAPWLAAAVALYDDAARDRPSPAVGAFAAALAHDLATLASEREIPAELRALAAQAVLATALNNGAPRAALRQALALDPERPALLAAAATDAMARGAFAEAEPLLDRWLAVAPASVEARVRLGELLLQTGRGERAASHWRAARDAARGEDAWLGALAAQELARQALGKGDAASAERLARAGLARFPGDEKLALLLAAALEAAGRHAAATEALAGLVPAAEGDGPRFRFGRLAADQGMTARAALSAGAERFRGSLGGTSAASGGRP